MTQDELSKLAKAWIAGEGQYCEAWEILCNLVLFRPEDAWFVIQEIASQEIPEHVTANLAAGPLEDLLVHHGQAFIDCIENKAKSDPRFAHILAGVWQNKIDVKVWRRIEQVRSELW